MCTCVHILNYIEVKVNKRKIGLYINEHYDDVSSGIRHFALLKMIGTGAQAKGTVELFPLNGKLYNRNLKCEVCIPVVCSLKSVYL